MSRTKGREGSPVSPPLKPPLESPLRTLGSSDTTCRPGRAVHAERVRGEIALAIDPDALCAVFGIDAPSVAARLLSQLVNVIQSDPVKLADAALMDQVLALHSPLCRDVVQRRGAARRASGSAATGMVGVACMGLGPVRRRVSAMAIGDTVTRRRRRKRSDR